MESPPPGGYLDPRALHACRNEQGELVVRVSGVGPGARVTARGALSECGLYPTPDTRHPTTPGSEATYEGVRPVRAFPFTAPEEQIALIDAEDREIGMIRDLDELDPASREAILSELAVAYLVPRVTAIRSVRSRFGVTTWDLETDRGPRVAHVKERTDIRLLPDGRTMLIDVHGVQYEIPPRDELEERSRFWLDIES